MGEWIYNSSFDTVMDFAVTVDNVFKRYGQVEALQGVSLSVRPGELFGIIGPDGAHVRGYNAHSLGICYEGGLDAHGHPADTRTDFQKHSLRVLVMLLLRDYPGSRLCGHRDLSPDLNGNGEIEPEEWIKECPCFDAAAIVREAAPPNPGCAG